MFHSAFMVQGVVDLYRGTKIDDVSRFPSMVSQLSWPDCLEYRGSINEATGVHHLPDPPCVANIRERISVEEDQIGPLPHAYGAKFLIRAEYAGGGARAGMDRLRRS